MDTRAQLTFLAKQSPAPVYRPSVGGAQARLDVSGAYEQHEVDILDGRRLEEAFDLDTQGFRLMRHDTNVTDFYDAGQRARVHEAECREAVIAATGATRAVVFDHTARSGDPARREEKAIREPTTVIHNDYTPRSAPQRVRDIMGNEAEALLEKPLAIVNVWRPIRPVESFPLAVCDARSLAPNTLVRAERRAKDRIGEIFMVRFDPRQRWLYFPGMRVEEILLIKTYDSREDGRTRWSVHTAFDDPNSKPDAAPRESIETRLFVFFDS